MARRASPSRALSYLIYGVLAVAALFAILWPQGKAEAPVAVYSIPSSEARLLVVGDMMFDRTMRSVGERLGYGYLFSCVGDYLDGFDLVVGNLEGPITYSSSLSLGTKPGEPGNTSFTFSPLAAHALFDHRARLVNIGNNHISDFGRSGIESTRRVLEDNGISYFGAPWGGDIATTTEAGDMRVSFANYNEFLGQGDPERTIRAIEAARGQGGFVAAYAHWGEEYSAVREIDRALAHSFIDAGADAVFGSHPHVIQETEWYKGKPIYYSLGNFIFDQYWDESVRTGKGVEVTIRDGKASYSDAVFDLGRDGRVCRKASSSEAVDNSADIL